MAQLSLSFINTPNPELEATRFAHPLLAEERCCMRGNAVWSGICHGSFQWTSAVKACSVLLLRTLAAALKSECQEVPALVGGRGSPASTFDYALSKQPAWLVDVFGADSNGLAIARRLFRRSNPELKRPGPVIISVNENALSARAIEVFLDGQRVRGPELLLEMAGAIELVSWHRNQPQQLPPPWVLGIEGYRRVRAAGS